MKSFYFSTLIIAVIAVGVSCAGLKHHKNKYSVLVLGNLYAEAINDSYTYMFDLSGRTKLSINDMTHGQFKAQFKGLFLYSGLKKSIGNLLQSKSGISANVGDFYNIQIYEQLAGGIQASIHGDKELLIWNEDYEDKDHKFFHYNPLIIEWGIDNLIINPSEYIGDKKAQEVFDFHMQRFCRQLTVSYLYLKNVGYQEEQMDYAQEMQYEDFNGLIYLFQNFDNNSIGNYEVNYDDYMNPMTIGFWLRRGLDDTHEVFWKGLMKVMNLYDKEWLNQTLLDLRIDEE